MQTFQEFFEVLTNHPTPRDWQKRLADLEPPDDRLLSIPTGFGKTLGVFAAWAWHRLLRNDDRWPRRLVWCLPMRVLTEQTAAEVEAALSRIGRLWDGRQSHELKVGVHRLMGGEDAGEWHLHPERCAVLVGTQDMLLSRALNRGYAAPRARWPMEFGLLNQDALWVMDEIQLMDVGLATSAQLQAFRHEDRIHALRPCATWWMSATLQRDWLRSVDTRRFVESLPLLDIQPTERSGHLWDDVAKPLRVLPAEDRGSWPKLVAEQWRAHGAGKLTLVVVNTVDKATALHAALARELRGELPEDDLKLVHSRFRAVEREAWRREFLRRDAPLPPEGRLIVATQVVEAGVDLDAALLITEIAPWPSLVQRFGRAARDGGTAPVLVLDSQSSEDRSAERAAAPYSPAELRAAARVLTALTDVAPAELARIEDGLDATGRAELYPYRPTHLLLRREWQELFDTTPDLTGADLDVSRYLRNGDERDLLVFWVEVEAGEPPGADLQPSRASLCPVPFSAARDWLCAGKGEKLAPGRRAWMWEWLEGRWREARRSALLPGRIVLVDSTSGGYSPARGFDPRSNAPVPVVAVSAPHADTAADLAQDAEALSAYPWRTIATHGGEVATEVRAICDSVALDTGWRRLLDLAARWHDVGKAHPAFQGSMRLEGQRPARQDLAKAPVGAWSRRHLYLSMDGHDRRPGLRHELASALALFAVLLAHRPDHPALLGPWSDLLASTGDAAPPATSPLPPGAAEQEIIDLDGPTFDLLAYLVASHHGKVRASLHAAPADQDYTDRDGRGLPIRGVREGDRLPALPLAGAAALPELNLTLEPAAAGLSPRTGASWSERVLGLLDRHGPAALAYLEALLRAADIRASRLHSTPDPLLGEEQG